MKGEPGALTELDPEYRALPDDFMAYVATGSPGHALLVAPFLDEYVYSGEAMRSTQSTVLLDLISRLAKLRRLPMDLSSETDGDLLDEACAKVRRT